MSDDQPKKPVVAACFPKLVNVTKGERYFWCTCGQSSSQPFCDGSHKDTTFKPLKYVPTEDGDVFFCQCKYTQKAPFCDGSHDKAALIK